MLFNTTFNNIPAISWRSVLLLVETELPGENHRPAASHWQILSYYVVLSKSRLRGIRTRNVKTQSNLRSRPWQPLAYDWSVKDKWRVSWRNVVGCYCIIRNVWNHEKKDKNIHLMSISSLDCIQITNVDRMPNWPELIYHPAII